MNSMVPYTEKGGKPSKVKVTLGYNPVKKTYEQCDEGFTTSTNKTRRLTKE